MVYKEMESATYPHYSINQEDQAAGESVAPVVSIGLPVFNGGKYLREALDSLLNQTFSNFELIVSDNASIDSTMEILKEYQRRDSRIRYYRQPKTIDPGENFLFVLKQARGRFFMWAAHDDSWAANWLEVLIDNLRPEDIGVRGGLLLVSDDKVVAKKTLPNYQQRNFIRCFLGNETNFRSHYAYSLFFREKLLATSLETLTLSYYPDALFVYCLLEQGALRTIPGTHIRYRLHPENLGLEYSSQWKGWRKVLYRIHPFRYYIYYLRYTNKPFTWLSIAALIPVKHVYAQISFWCRGFQQIITARIRS